MNKDQVKGATKDIVGKLQEAAAYTQAAGKFVGSSDQQVLGLKNQAKGKVQQLFGNLKEVVKDTTNKP
jgi:uncharacterized protein YjbJ (UPF0337 family)